MLFIPSRHRIDNLAHKKVPEYKNKFSVNFVDNSSSFTILYTIGSKTLVSLKIIIEGGGT